MQDENQKFTPIEKRELRGLTLENVIKYGIAIIALIAGYLAMQGKINDLEKTVKENQGKIDVNSKKIETLNINQQTTEVWKGRFEEKLNNQRK